MLITINTPVRSSDHDKLHKVRPLIEKINANAKKAYSYSEALSIDESMIPFKGRSTLKQYMPMKPIKRGYKVWCIADHRTGYIYGFDIYTGLYNLGIAILNVFVINFF